MAPRLKEPATGAPNRGMGRGMAPPAEKIESLPLPPITPSVEEWRAMSPEARLKHILAVQEALSDRRLAIGDGRPHFQAKRRATDRLKRHFDALRRVIYLAEEMDVLYPGERGFCPDIFAVLDVAEPEDDERMAWVVADEGRGLDLVIEVLYKGDRQKDLVVNVERYARLGIPEYFVYDRKRQELRGYCLPTPTARRYQRIVPQAGRHTSAVLGLDLAIENGKLEFFHGMAALFGTEDLIGRLRGMMQSLEGKADEARAEAESARAALQDGILALLEARGLDGSQELRERVRACSDVDTLKRWLIRAATAASMAEALAEP